jgi:type I restriction enzyme S subunit
VKFLFYLLSIIDWQSYNEASGVPSLNANTVQNIKIFLPPTLDEQRAIAAVLADMDAEIAALEARREKVRQVKQGMMQVLLTGKVRLVTPAIQNNVFPSSSSRSSNA